MEVIKNTNNETIVKISGRWDTTNVSEYGKELEQILENAATAIIFECESLDYISSSGLRVFLLAQKKISSRGEPPKTERRRTCSCRCSSSTTPYWCRSATRSRDSTSTP